jgi:Galactose oxidase, central domain
MSNLKTSQWQRHDVQQSPPPRKGGTMGYDAQRGEVVLFGGGGLDDTWIWDSHTWVQRVTATSPSGRTHASMSYDAARAKLLLFGGVASDGQLLNDTWLWDGQYWIEQTGLSAPLARCGASMHYDPRASNVLLFGGQSAGDRAGKLLNDTWVWNGATWTQRAPHVSPSPRFGAAIAYHVGQQQMLLFGGTTGAAPTNDTWLWNGHSWQQLTPVSSPPARAWANFVYHHGYQKLTLIGGSGDGSEAAMMNLSDTWLWNGVTWEPYESVALDNTDANNMPQGSHKSAAYVDHQQAVIIYTATDQKELSTLSTIPDTDLATMWQSETWLWME